jgi:hypothetical protein
MGVSSGSFLCGLSSASGRGGAGLQVSEAWAENGAALAPAELKTLVKMARDIYRGG